MKIAIYVRPSASVTSVGGEFDGALVIRVRDVPENGRATEAALSALARALGLPRRSLSLVRGATSRRKLVEIEADHEKEVEAVLDGLRKKP